MKIGIVLLVGMILFSCTDKKEDVLSYDDLKRNDTDVDFTTDTTTIPKGVTVDPTFPLANKMDSLVGKGSWQTWDSLLYVQRFGPEKLQTWKYLTPTDSIFTFQLAFADSLKTVNAFYNWLDCFGKNCTSVKINGKFKHRGRPQYILVSNSGIFFLEAGKHLKAEKLLHFLNPDRKKQNWNYFLELNPGKEMLWEKVQEGEIEKLNGL